MKIVKKRKASLAATLLLCIIIITISTYVMKWVFERYTTATRFHRSSIALTRTEGIFYNRISCCQYGSNCISSVDGKSVNISGLNCNASAATSVTFSIDADN